MWGGDPNLTGLFLYLIDMMPLLNLGAGPLLSSEFWEVSLLFLVAIILLTTARLFEGDFIFVISDFSLGGEGYLDEVPLFRRIFLTVLLEVEDTIELKGMIGPLTIFTES